MRGAFIARRFALDFELGHDASPSMRAQQAARAMQLCLRGTDRHAKLAADLLVLPAFDIMQYQHGARPRRQLRDGLFEVGALAGAERDDRVARSFEHVGVDGIFRIAGAEVHERHVDRKTVKPR